MLLSAALMLDWLGERHDLPAASAAAQALEQAIATGFAAGAISPVEQGGSQGTRAVAAAVIAQL
jgi:3-isopropylmalate dehydrogenase